MIIKLIFLTLFCWVSCIFPAVSRENPAKPAIETDIQIFVNRPLILEITKLTEPEQAIVASVSAEYNTGCQEVKCSLTTALKLGDQCSQIHQNFLKKWYGQGAVECQYAPDNAPTYQTLKTFILNRQRENVWNGYLKYIAIERGDENKCFFQKRSIILVSGVLVQVIEKEESCDDIA